MVSNVLLTGNETLLVVGQDGKGYPAATAETVSVAQITSIDLPSYGVNAIVGAQTLTVLNVLAAAANANVPDTVVLNLTGTQTGAATVTTPTAVLWIAAIPNLILGNSYILRVINSSSGAFTITVAGGTGVTVNGTATVAQNTWREFIVNFPTATTVTMQSIGTGTYS